MRSWPGKFVVSTVLAFTLLCGSVFAQRRNEPPPPKSSQKPIGQYAMVVFLLAVPIGLVCRSSRRM